MLHSLWEILTYGAEQALPMVQTAPDLYRAVSYTHLDVYKRQVDASETAVLQARRNASLNGLDGTVKFLCEDVFELLPELEEKLSLIHI